MVLMIIRERNNQPATASSHHLSPVHVSFPCGDTRVVIPMCRYLFVNSSSLPAALVKWSFCRYRKQHHRYHHYHHHWSNNHSNDFYGSNIITVIIVIQMILLQISFYGSSPPRSPLPSMKGKHNNQQQTRSRVAKCQQIFYTDICGN